jgi:hypothetical protein
MSNKDKAIAWGIQDEETVKRFKSKLVEKPNGCVEFNGPKWDKRDLYRMFSIWKTKKTHGQYERLAPVKAHRFSYALTHGIDALPKSKVFTGDSKIINHICHNKACVKPEHLNILTSRENTNADNRKPQ